MSDDRDPVRDPVQVRVDQILFAAARKAYGYVPACERPERVAEEFADED